jgi:hypothetical protein
VREHLRFAEERDGGDGRSQDDAVINEIPETQDTLEVRLLGRACLPLPEVVSTVPLS